MKDFYPTYYFVFRQNQTLTHLAYFAEKNMFTLLSEFSGGETNWFLN